MGGSLHSALKTELVNVGSVLSKTNVGDMPTVHHLTSLWPIHP